MGNAEYMGILTRVITMFRTSLLLALAACVSAEPGVYPLAYGGYGSYSLGTGVGIAGYAPAAVPGLLGGYAGSGRYVANSGGVVHIAKREAEAEPGYGYGLYGGYGIGGFGTGVGIAGYAPAAVPGVYGGYAGAGRYVANSAGVVHVAKRDAEAEAEPGYLGHYGSGDTSPTPLGSFMLPSVMLKLKLSQDILVTTDMVVMALAMPVILAMGDTVWVTEEDTTMVN